MKFLNKEILLRKTIDRAGESKIGENILCFTNGDNLDDLKKYAGEGVKYALLGIPESIGIKANFGRGGAERAWNCFLNSFLNMQSNRYVSGEEILCIGNIYTDELQAEADRLEYGSPDYFVQLRSLCSQLDDLVYPAIKKIVEAKLIPIIIGGGHNNVFPILKGICQVAKFKSGINCINCDAHADFRILEGRHSGNGFSYAFEHGYLKNYYVLGLHEDYNSESTLQKLDALPSVDYAIFEPSMDLEAELEKASNFFENKKEPLGLELDLDSICNMSASAFTPSGLTIEQARRFITTFTTKHQPIYFHLSEGAPTSQIHEQAYVGKALAYFVRDFIKAHNTI